MPEHLLLYKERGGGPGSPGRFLDGLFLAQELHERELIKKKKQYNSEYFAHNKVRLIRGGKDYFDLMLQMIAQAKDTIHLQVYIFDDDETGITIANALKAAALRKVQVYLMVDGYASQVMSQRFIDDLKDAGIHFRFFQPLFKSKYFYFGRRLHHKIFVSDTRYALVGGVNISNRYNDMPEQPAWLDFALYAEGEIAKQLCVLCWKGWKDFPSKMGLTPCEEKELTFNIPNGEASQVRMRRNDWVRRKNQISRTYLELLKNSATNITILCSYFLPGRSIKRNLEQAVKRGVKIKLILAGLSDIKMAKYAERYIYDWLLRNKIEIYEYQNNVLHGKIAVCDSEWLTIGSYNINDLSAHASIELNLDVKDTSFAKKVEATLDQIIRENCLHITTKRLSRSTNIFKRFIRWGSYELIKLSLFLFTSYFRQKN